MQLSKVQVRREKSLLLRFHPLLSPFRMQYILQHKTAPEEKRVTLKSFVSPAFFNCKSHSSYMKIPDALPYKEM